MPDLPDYLRGPCNGGFFLVKECLSATCTIIICDPSTEDIACILCDKKIIVYENILA